MSFKLKEKLNKSKIDIFISENKYDIQYLSKIPDIEGSLLLIFKDKKVILSNKIYLDYLREKTKDFIIEEITPKTIKKYIKNHTYGIDPYSFSYISAEKLKTLNKNIKFLPDFLNKIRAIKKEDEISKIKSSVNKSKAILKSFYKLKLEKLTEIKISKYLKEKILNMKLEEAFPNIVASYKNTSFPHHIPENKKIKNFFLVDFGIKKDCYCSDLTRFFIIDKMKLNPLIKKALRDVFFAKKMAESLIKPGKRISDVVMKVEEYLKKNGWTHNIYHTLGHGIGIEVHEYPSLSNRNKNTFKENMVFTIEPGLYIKGTGGVRIEDVYLLKKEGVKKL